MTLPRGMVLHNRYIVLRLLGQGATGAVYLARDNRFKGMSWAVKELQTGAMEPGDRTLLTELFIHESQILKDLDHPGLPRIEDFFVQNETHYLVMERVEGPTLDDLLRERRKPVTQQEVYPWALRICEILQYLHSRTPPVIFRDLKPSNVMLTREGAIKFIDLGIARFFNPRKKTDTHVMGTPGFCPPEQYRGHTDVRSDIYAFGATLFHLLTKADVERFAFKFPLLRALNAEVTEEMEALVAKCVAVDPAGRHQSVRELEEELRRIRSHRTPLLKKVLARLPLGKKRNA